MITTTANRDELILSHMPQVELLARRLHGRCPQVELDDLISAGTIGLIQAVDRVPKDRLGEASEPAGIQAVDQHDHHPDRYRENDSYPDESWTTPNDALHGRET